MSGNAAFDRQLAQAMIPRYNPSQALQQMQRQPVQIQPWQSRVQNPIFGGTIPMNFGLPPGAQLPAGYQSPIARAANRPPPPSAYVAPAAPAPVATGSDWASTLGWNPGGYFNQGPGGGGGD